MRYDDRLQTVLAQPASDPHDRAVRWRQLVELLARGIGRGALFDQALAEVERDSPAIDEQVRMAAARAIAPLPAPVELIRAFAADRLSVAAPVLAAARLTASDWAEVTAGASGECRRFIASLRADSADTSGTPAFPPPPEPPQLQPASPPRRTDPAAPIPSISEVLARIERLRSGQAVESDVQAAAPALDAPTHFRWECDASGDILWVDGVPRGAVIGRSIARGGEGGDIQRNVERAFAKRLPFNDARLELAEGSIAGGSWKISGVPVFDPADGHFSGYHGVAEREITDPSLILTDPDSLRELAHELKTPLNAIIGFAEIISGQYLGPADKPYRDRADTIVAQARLLVTAIDDLDFAARLRGRERTDATSNLADVIAGLKPELAQAGASFSADTRGEAALDPTLGTRVVSRFFEAAIAVSPDPQHFTLSDNGRNCVLSAVNPGVDPDSEPALPLRLAIGLARLAGGEVKIGARRLDLLLPRA